jgi:peptide/nickel transport system permease protein
VIRFLARRLAAGLVTLIVASIVIFLATNALPGNVASAVLGRNATPARVAALSAQLKLDRPLVDRYGSWLGGVVQGNLGESAVQLAQGATPASASVGAEIGTPLRNSLVLAVITTLLLIPLSLILGTLSGIKRGMPTDAGISYFTLALAALPEFVLGTFLILIFFSELHLLPPVALIPPGTSPLASPNQLVLPVCTLLGVTTAFCARQIRAGVTQVIRTQYVTMATLDGLPRTRVILLYVLRNSLAPSIQSFAQSITYLLGGIIVVESLFAYPGIGTLLVQAVSTRDIPVVASVTLILAAVYIVINIIADLLVVLVVPKLRSELK